MAEIQQPRFNETLRRLTAMKVGAPSPNLESSIVPVLDLDSIGRPEYAFLGGNRLCARTATVAAVAAEFGVVALLNPAGSRMLVVVRRVGGQQSANNIFIGQITAATLTALALAGSGSGVVRDSRWFQPGGIGQSSAAIFTFGTTATVPPTEGYIPHPTPELNDVAFVIAPGFALGVFNGVANTSLSRAGFVWDERAANPDEL